MADPQSTGAQPKEQIHEMQAAVKIERSRWVDFASLWSSTGYPAEKVYSAFIAQTLSLSPPFREFFLYRIFERAGRFSEYKALGVAEENEISIRTEAYLARLDDDEVVDAASSAEYGRPKDLRCALIDLEINIGHKFTIAVENKIRSRTLSRLQPDQLPRYQRHLRRRGTPFILALLCPRDYRVHSRELPTGNLIRLSYGELACWTRHFLGHHPLGAFEAAYFRAFQRFLARIEITYEDKRIVSLREYSAGDIILCKRESGPKRDLVTRIDYIQGTEVGLTHFYDEPTDHSRPVTEVPPPGIAYFQFCESWPYRARRSPEGNLLFRFERIECCAVTVPTSGLVKLKVPPLQNCDRSDLVCFAP